MKVQEVRAIAQQHKIKTNGQSKTDLIRIIQRQEGNFDCFASAGNNECDQLACLWRADCFQAAAA